MFITFEGIDGVGKSTQIELLRNYLLRIGKEVIVLREPGGTRTAEAIREILLSAANHLNPMSELLLFEAARASIVEEVIKPALDKGSIVLCDRFHDSTTAYQGYGRQLPLEYVELCNKIATNGLKPDITIFLDLPLEKASERTGNRIQDRIESSGNDFFERVIHGFRKISESEPKRFIHIDASFDIMETHKLILEKISLVLTERLRG